MDKAISDFYRMAENLDKPKTSIHPDLRRNSERANQMTIDDPKHREHVVCDMGNHNYQIYLRVTADKWEREFKYSTVEGFVNA